MGEAKRSPADRLRRRGNGAGSREQRNGHDVVAVAEREPEHALGSAQAHQDRPG